MIYYSLVQDSHNPVITATGTIATTVINFCNTSSTQSGVIDVCIVNSGDVPKLENMVLTQYPIPTQDSFEYNTEKYVLGNGDYISVSGSITNIISAVVSYINYPVYS